MNKEYVQLINELRQNIVQSRYVAARLANREQLLLYWRTGKALSEKIAKGKWGAKILEQVAADLQKQIPGLKGFSHRSLKNMRHFHTEYQHLTFGQSLPAQLRDIRSTQKAIVQSLPGQLQKSVSISENQASKISESQLQSFFGISFTHHILILNKCTSQEERFFYIQEAATHFWSVNTLEHYIVSDQFNQQGKLPNNFDKTVQTTLQPSALQVFQDEYLMDFLSPTQEDDERDLEGKVVADIKNFILRIGKGFCFIGNQYRLELAGEEFFVDLLFFNRHLQCLVAFELKRGKFKPEYAGQLNFYLNVLDEKVKLPAENPSIGIVLCKEKNNTVELAKLL